MKKKKKKGRVVGCFGEYTLPEKAGDAHSSFDRSKSPILVVFSCFEIDELRGISLPDKLLNAMPCHPTLGFSSFFLFWRNMEQNILTFLVNSRVHTEEPIVIDRNRYFWIESHGFGWAEFGDKRYKVWSKYPSLSTEILSTAVLNGLKKFQTGVRHWWIVPNQLIKRVGRNGYLLFNVLLFYGFLIHLGGILHIRVLVYCEYGSTVFRLLSWLSLMILVSS